MRAPPKTVVKDWAVDLVFTFEAWKAYMQLQTPPFIIITNCPHICISPNLPTPIYNIIKLPKLSMRTILGEWIQYIGSSEHSH